MRFGGKKEEQSNNVNDQQVLISSYCLPLKLVQNLNVSSPSPQDSILKHQNFCFSCDSRADSSLQGSRLQVIKSCRNKDHKEG